MRHSRTILLALMVVLTAVVAPARDRGRAGEHDAAGDQRYTDSRCHVDHDRRGLEQHPDELRLLVAEL